MLRQHPSNCVAQVYVSVLQRGQPVAAELRVMPQQGGFNGADSPAVHPFPAGAQRQTWRLLPRPLARRQPVNEVQEFHARLHGLFCLLLRPLRTLRIPCLALGLLCKVERQTACGQCSYSGPDFQRRDTQRVSASDTHAGPTLAAQGTAWCWREDFRYLKHTQQHKDRGASQLPATSATTATTCMQHLWTVHDSKVR